MKMWFDHIKIQLISQGSNRYSKRLTTSNFTTVFTDYPLTTTTPPNKLNNLLLDTS